MTNRCAICGSERFVDRHHLDCQRGALSPLTIPLCRRCHRSYHDWGISCFSPDTTEKALEVENIKRGIYREPPLLLSEIVRSSYWRAKWKVPKKAKVAKKEPGEATSPQLSLF